MTEIPSNNPEQVPEKLQIDDLSSFQFHAAYLAYSELFDNAKSAEDKRDLNRSIEDLKQNAISPEIFYANISRFRRDGAPDRRQNRFSVTTQRKRDWRMKSQKQDRIKRHKK